ncbi:MAG: anthranilate synthase component I [Actinomycetota bacterium]
MYHPSRSEFKELTKKYNLIPVYREIVADTDTPVSAFKKLGESTNAFLLESVEGGERLGRYSFLGNNPYLVITCDDGDLQIMQGQKVTKISNIPDPLKIIEEIISQYRPAQMEEPPPFYGGAVGYLGYDVIRYFEDIPRTTQDDLHLPEMIFVFTDTILIFDHLKHKIKVVANAHIDQTYRQAGGEADEAYDQAICKVEDLIEKLKQPVVHTPLREYSHVSAGISHPHLESNMSKEDFIEAVSEAKGYIRAGDILQVVLSQRFSTEIKADPFDIYRALRMINPSPYMYYLKFGDLKLIGSSPEPLVKVQGSYVITRPIAGTRPRGGTDEEDRKLETELLSDEKERAEHIMLVDLGRNDLGRVCKPGSVKVEELMFIERYSHVMHIVSTVGGTLRKDKNAFDVLRAAFPAGTVTGAPKIRAMEIIDELEPTLRGPYAGAVGYFSYSGNLDSCITIRTIIVVRNKAYVQAGAGIVYDSVPEREFQESVNKAQALLSAVHMAENSLGSYK